MKRLLFLTLLSLTAPLHAQQDLHASFTGRYLLTNGLTIQVIQQDQRLVLVVPGAPLQELKSIATNKFQSRLFPDQFFTFTKTNETTQVLSQAPHETLNGTKLDNNVKVWSITMDSILPLTKATQHFTIRYNPTDASVIDSIASAFENNYTRILSDFQIKTIPTVTIRIYPNLAAFHKGINFPNAPDQVLATAFGKDDIRMVSPNNAGPESWMLTHAAPHEFTHCVHLNIDYAPNNPRWLWESIAQYESSWFFNPNDIDFMKKKEYPAFADLTNGLEYMLGYTIIEAIRDLWGPNTVIALIKNRGNAQKTLKLNQKLFEEKIFSHIHKKYIKD